MFGAISILKINAASSSSILVNMTPENPAPYEDINIVLSSYADNLDSVLITWSLDGKNAFSGIGKKSFSLKAPAAGSETTVLAVLSLPAGNIETKMTIRPSIMVLLWQANDSYLPPFYKGKALPTPDSGVKVVAMPEIRNSGKKLISSANMIYNWKKDYTNDQGASGYGKNFFTYVNDYLDNSNNISVMVSTTDGQNSANASIDIGTTQPKILFYKNNNMGTVWEKTLTNPHKIQGDEIVVAIPYFISPKEIQNPRLIWNWFINDNLVNVSGFRKNFMPLKVQEGVSGTSKLRLDIENKDKIFQNTSKEINIEF